MERNSIRMDDIVELVRKGERVQNEVRSSSGHLRLNSSSDDFFKQASSEHSLLTQKILLEIRRNTTLIPTGYHTNTLINVP